MTCSFWLDDNNPVQANWKKEFVKRAGYDPSAIPVSAYDTFLCIAEAVRKCGTGPITRKTIRDNLQNLDWKEGVSGPVKFNPAGDLNKEQFILGIEDEKFLIKQGFGFAN
jgi:branched-chain amino acid transport system substrate-binding protein